MEDAKKRVRRDVAETPKLREEAGARGDGRGGEGTPGIRALARGVDSPRHARRGCPAAGLRDHRGPHHDPPASVLALRAGRGGDRGPRDGRGPRVGAGAPGAGQGGPPGRPAPPARPAGRRPAGRAARWGCTRSMRVDPGIIATIGAGGGPTSVML